MFGEGVREQGEQPRDSGVGDVGPSAAILHVQRVGGRRRRQVELGATPLTIGRSSENALVLRHGDVSRRHCVVEPCPEGFRLNDLGSRFGTLVNGERVAMRLLSDSDRIRIGPYELIVSLVGEASTPAPTASAHGGGAVGPPSGFAPSDAPAQSGSHRNAVPSPAGGDAQSIAPLKEALQEALLRIRHLEREQSLLRRRIADRSMPRSTPNPDASDARVTAGDSSAGKDERPPVAPIPTSLPNPLVAAMTSPTQVAGADHARESLPAAPSRSGLRDDSWADRDYLSWLVVGVCAIGLVSALVLGVMHLLDR